MLVSTTLTSRVQWSDLTLMSVPCRAALPSMLSLASTADDAVRAQQAADTQLQWVPNVTIAGQSSSRRMLESACRGAVQLTDAALSCTLQSTATAGGWTP